MEKYEVVQPRPGRTPASREKAVGREQHEGKRDRGKKEKDTDREAWKRGWLAYPDCIPVSMEM
ncbi:hypothetical protein MJO28_002269 [Puccinia striiformis f. sp. tritici]|uniref:Uncharacterized protein n=1 Tax=Puccinia striiformis f. sp. tritici TaxID=168172 RepID=A0ACC0EY16_9BASI|nr:hypothetical protein MJO28_002269 [Puccinia striiformis f. sp. tritici]